MCLDLKDGNTGEGGQVQQWQCYRGRRGAGALTAGNQNQQWIVDNKGLGAGW